MHRHGLFSTGEDIMQTFIDKYINQGLHQGLHQGETEMLVRQMEVRFGSLPQWAKQKIGQADITSIRDCSIRLLNANSIEETLMKGNTFIDKYINQGFEQGFQQGQAEILIRQMESRFGSLPQWAKEKIEQADITAIEDWGIRLLSANSLKEVLAGDVSGMEK